ncbi:MAG: hypothetical protein CMI96_04355 [Pelagibacteraceae bacterium]|nr:hypothetical protein [Pelagibacteraceae bacterium]
MARDIHGVNNLNKLFFSNYSLTYQIFFINLLISFFGFIAFIIFNYYIIQNDKKIQKQYDEVLSSLNNINDFLEKNSIVRVPLFDDSCQSLDKNKCIQNMYNKENLEWSEPLLEPTTAQKYIIQGYLNKIFEVKIYNDNLLNLVDTKKLFLSSQSQIEEIAIFDQNKNVYNIYKNYQEIYRNLFFKFYLNISKKKFEDNIIKKEHDINIVQETIRSRELIKKTYIDKENVVSQFFSIPIINNNSVYGVLIISYPIFTNNFSLELISFSLFNFYILFVIIMILLSFFFSRSLIMPIKTLTNLTLIERDKLNKKNKLLYPKRGDEIGILSKEIQAMSKDLKSQIDQLERFASDVSHELKNPLTSLYSATELLNNKKISDLNKQTLISNIYKDVKRMNILISDISNYTRLKAEVETENFEFINISSFISELIENYKENKKSIKIIQEIEQNSLYVLANINKLYRVFTNLIDNSMSIADKNSKILITVSNFKNQYVHVKIYDQGKGINFLHKDKVFERFYTDRDANNFNHTGLGLSIVKEILHSFKGEIMLIKTDNKKYSGACFMIKLPLKVKKN